MTGRVLGVIPARGGSKRVPRKNIRDVGGKPLIAYAIEQASQAKTLDTAIVSTEDDEIRDVAREYGGSVPFERPAHLASDDATIDEVIEHALDWHAERGETFDAVCAVTVTTPLRDPRDIDGAVDRLFQTGGESVVSVTAFDDPPFWAVETDDEGYLSPYFGEGYLWSTTRTQEVPDLHRPNASVYVATVSAFDKHGSFYTDETRGYEMPRERSLDIDEPFDLKIADALLSREDT
jgi:CMP-N-acetylneuraminic acid synthetase